MCPAFQPHNCCQVGAGTPGYSSHNVDYRSDLYLISDVDSQSLSKSKYLIRPYIVLDMALVKLGTNTKFGLRNSNIRLSLGCELASFIPIQLANSRVFIVTSLISLIIFPPLDALFLTTRQVRQNNKSWIPTQSALFAIYISKINADIILSFFSLQWEA